MFRYRFVRRIEQEDQVIARSEEEARAKLDECQWSITVRGDAELIDVERIPSAKQ